MGLGQPLSTFIGSLLADARNHGRVTIQQPASMSKDYVALNDVVRLLPQIVLEGKERLYNLGSGFNTTHSEVAEWLKRQGIMVDFQSKPCLGLRFPVLSIERLSAEFQPPGPPFLQNLYNR